VHRGVQQGRVGVAGAAGRDADAPPILVDQREGLGGVVGRVHGGTLGRAATLQGMASVEELRAVLNTGEDTERGMGIVDLGLVYDVELEGTTAKVTYTLTSMGCPVGPYIQEQIYEVAHSVEGVEDVTAELVWTPPWSPDRMSEDAKFVLGF